MSRVHREQLRQAKRAAELFPWEITKTKVTAWEPKYDDEKRFYYASKVEEGKLHLTGAKFDRYLRDYGGRYFLSKYVLPSPAALPDLNLTRRETFTLSLSAPTSTLNYWFLNLLSGQRPAGTIQASSLVGGSGGSKNRGELRVTLSPSSASTLLAHLHPLFPRKDLRDMVWSRPPRSVEHGQYRLRMDRILAEGPTRQLNQATQAFIDQIQFQCNISFKQKIWQNRNLHAMQFMGMPQVKIVKKWGGEIEVPKMVREM